MARDSILIMRSTSDLCEVIPQLAIRIETSFLTLLPPFKKKMAKSEANYWKNYCLLIERIAFNGLNRDLTLKAIDRLCQFFYQFICFSYREPSNLFINKQK